MPRGHHIIAEFRKCNPSRIEFIKSVKPIIEKSVQDSGLTKIYSEYHQFEPFGVTGFVLLAYIMVATGAYMIAKSTK
jgi:S-adenosylmethionine/arginine decarboxylase-like enzyme